MATTDEIIKQAWREGQLRAVEKRSGIGDVTENPKIVGPLVYAFAQFGEPSCVRAVNGERHDSQG
jgi:hypothetical protein